MKKFYSLILVAVIFNLFHTTSYAENRGNAYYLMVGGGYDFFATNRHIENTGIPFLALGYNFTKHWGFEALVGIFDTNFKKSVQDNREIDGLLVLFDGVYHFTSFNRIDPFILAGFGLTGFRPNQNDATNEGNINAGIGVQFFANEIVALRLEARDIYTIVNGKNDVFIDGGVTFYIDLC